jgi:hypothetical protein
MTFALIAMCIGALILRNNGFNFEKMLPYLLIIGGIAFLFPFGAVLLLPFKLVGALIGGIFGLIGVTFGLVFGLIGGIIGLVFGAIGIVLGVVVLGFIPLVIGLVIYKLIV